MTNRLVARIGLGIAFTTVLATAATVPASAAPAAARTAVLKGQVFADANSNARADHGEGLRGASLKLSSFSTSKTYRITTGAKGRFRVVVPIGNYYYLSGGTKHWKVIPKSFRLHADGRDIALRAVKPLGKVLKASIRLSKDTYSRHERVRATVTLTNTGSKVLRGIAAACNRIGDPQGLVNRNSSWGDLAFDRSGVGLKSRATRTFHVSQKMPQAAPHAGDVFLDCDFGYPAVDRGYRPVAGDRARVPGEFGAIAGEVQYHRHGNLIGLAHVRVVLVDPDTCPVYTRRTTTGPHGHFRIGHVPAGSTYRLYLFPPDGWKVPRYNPASTLVFGNDTSRFGSEVVHGSKHVPDPPTTCG